MNITLDTLTLKAALERVVGVVERRNTIPILSTVRLTADAVRGRLTLSATDLDQLVTHVLPTGAGGLVIASGGDVAIAADPLRKIVGKLPKGGQLEIALDKNEQAVITAPGSRFTLPTLPGADMPGVSQGEGLVRARIAAGALARLLTRVSHAISTEETRYYLNGIYLHVRDGRFRVVATDGHQLSVADGPACETAEGAELPGVIIPRKTVGLLCAELGRLGEDDEVLWHASDTRILLELDDGEGRTLSLLSKVIDGTFPDYDRVVPAPTENVIRLSPSALGDAIERVQICAGGENKSRSIRLEVDDSGRLVLSGANAEEGLNAREDMPATTEGAVPGVGFNAGYMRAVLAAMGPAIAEAGTGELLIMLGEDGTKPSRWTTDADDDALSVLMPLRV